MDKFTVDIDNTDNTDNTSNTNNIGDIGVISMDEPLSIIEISGDSKKSKSIRKSKVTEPKFNESCTRCSKVFKSKNSYDTHTINQLCYKENEITYCKICEILHETHDQYNKHLFSLVHINNIGCNNLDKLEIKQLPMVNIVDPYLNSNDVKKIATKHLGDSFTFTFKKGNTQTVTLQQPKNSIVDKKTLLCNTVNSNTANTIQDLIQDSNNVHIVNEIHNTNMQPKSIEPTERQFKIILFLESQIHKSSIDESGKLFYKMLDNKLKLEDYKGLQNIIKNLKTLNEDYKQNYLNTVDLFISFLVKERTNGIQSYKDKDISQLVCNLTS
jgi:hypothetical protein